MRNSNNFAPLLSCFLLFISFAPSFQQTFLGKINFNSSDDLSKIVPDFTWTISDLKTRMNESDNNNFTLLSEVFPLKGYSFGAQAQLTLDKNKTDLWLSLCYKDLNNSRQPLNLNLFPAVTYTYKDDEIWRTVPAIRKDNILFASPLSYNAFSYNMPLCRFQDIANGTTSIDIAVEAPEVAAQSYSYDGRLTGHIDNFQKNKALEQAGSAPFEVSPYFYTGPKGYRVQAFIYLNGFGKYKGLSVAIAFLTGPNDAHLSTSFQHNTTVTLFLPTQPNVSLVKSVTRSNVSLYVIDVAPRLDTFLFIDNDTLHYRVEIVPV